MAARTSRHPEPLLAFSKTLSSSDAGSGSTEATTLVITSSDTGSGSTEATTLVITSSDTGSGSEASTLVITPAADTGTGSDASLLTITTSDTGSGSDDRVNTAALTDSDTGSGAEASDVAPKADPDQSSTTTETAAIAQSASDSGSGSDNQALTYIAVSGDTGTISVEFEDVGEPASDFGVATDVESLIAALSDADQNRTARGDTDAGSGGDTVGNQARSDADTGTGADAISGQRLVDTDNGTGADTQIFAHAAYTDTDNGTGTDPQSVSSQKFTDTDSGAGTDAELRRQWLVDQDYGRGETDFNVPVSQDAGTGTDAAVLTGFPGFDAGTGTDTESLVISPGSSLSDTDAGTGWDGNVDPLYAGPLWWWGADVSGVTVTPPAETDTTVEVEGLRAIQVAAAESGTASEAQTASAAGTNSFLQDSDSGTGADTQSTVTNGIILDVDQGGAVDQVTDRALFDPDTGAGSDVEGLSQLDPDGGDLAAGDDEENVGIALLDSAVGADEQTFVIADADTGAGADASSPAPPADRDSIVATETFNLAQVTADTGVGAESNQLSAGQAFTGVELGTGLEGPEHIYITLADSGSGAEATGNRGIADPDAGLGIDQILTLRVIGLVGTDDGKGRSFGVVSLPAPTDTPGALSFTADTPGSLSLTADTPGVLVMAAAVNGGLTLTADTPGTLVMVPDGDTQEP